MLKYRTKNNCILYIDCCLHCAKQATQAIENNILEIDKQSIRVYNAIDNDEIAQNIQSICNSPIKIKIILDDYFMSHIKNTDALQNACHTAIIRYIQNITVQRNMKVVIAKTHACSYAYHKLKIMKNISELQIDETYMLFNLKKIQQIEQHVQLVQDLCKEPYQPIVIDIEVKSDNILELIKHIYMHKNIVIYYNVNFLKSLIQILRSIHMLYHRKKTIMVAQIS